MASLFNILSTGNKDRTGNVVEININEIYKYYLDCKYIFTTIKAKKMCLKKK